MDSKEYKTTEVHRACSARYYENNKERLNARRAERHRELHPPKPKKQKIPKRVPVEKLERLPEDAVMDVGTNLFVRKLNEPTPINPISKSKKNEFLWIVEGITKHKFNELEWCGEEIVDDISRCICSQHIEHAYNIRHKPTGSEFRVGSQCVKKVSQELFDIITHDACKSSKCQRPVLDKRTACGKKGYCTESCRLNNTLTFGKYKGYDLKDVPQNYWDWINKTIANPDANAGAFFNTMLIEANDKKRRYDALDSPKN